MKDYYVKKVWEIVIHIVISSFLFGYTLGVFNTSSENVGATLGWGSLQTTYTALFSTIMPVGATVGASCTGTLMNRYGRRKSTIISCAIMIFGSAGSSIPYTFIFGIGRFSCGVAAGMAMAIPPSFVNEIAPDQIMHMAGPSVQISICVGMLVAFAIGIPLPVSHMDSNYFNYWWMFMFALPGILAAYQAWYFLWIFKFDTPFWLMMNNQEELSMSVLRVIYAEESIDLGFRKASHGLNRSVISELEKSELEKTPGYKIIFTRKKYRKMLRNGIVLSILQQFSGIIATTFYSTSLFKQINGDMFMSRIYTTIMGLVNLISSLFSIYLLSNYGRKPLLIYSQMIMAAVLGYLGLSYYLQAPPLASVFGIIFFAFIFSYSLGATLWTYYGEALLEKIIGLAGSINLICMCAVSAAFPISVENLGLPSTFFFFAGCMVIGVIYSCIDLIETKDKVKSDIMEAMMLDITYEKF